MPSELVRVTFSGEEPLRILKLEFGKIIDAAENNTDGLAGLPGLLLRCGRPLPPPATELLAPIPPQTAPDNRDPNFKLRIQAPPRPAPPRPAPRAPRPPRPAAADAARPPRGCSQVFKQLSHWVVDARHGELDPETQLYAESERRDVVPDSYRDQVRYARPPGSPCLLLRPVGMTCERDAACPISTG